MKMGLFFDAKTSIIYVEQLVSNGIVFFYFFLFLWDKPRQVGWRGFLRFGVLHYTFFAALAAGAQWKLCPTAAGIPLGVNTGWYVQRMGHMWYNIGNAAGCGNGESYAD